MDNFFFFAHFRITLATNEDDITENPKTSISLVRNVIKANIFISKEGVAIHSK